MRRTHVFWVAVLVGCQGGLGAKIREFPADAASQGYRLLPKPILLPAGETSYDCGPESLGAVLQFWGKPCDVQVLSRLLVNPELKSTSTDKIAPALRKMGMAATHQPGSMLLLKEAIDAGKPPIVAVRLAKSAYHYYVVSGYNDRLGVAACEERDGTKTLLPFEQMDYLWRETGYFLLAVEPSSAAADFDEGAEYERAGNSARAAELFRRALKADPTFHEARLGLGNCLLAEGKLEEAAKEYEQVLEATPEDPKVLNNLANVLVELGRDLARAEELSGKAVEAYSESRRRLEAGIAAAKDEVTRAARKRDLREREIELAFALGTLGQARFKREVWDRAIAAWKAALDTIPLDFFDFRAKRHYEIAMAGRKMGMASEARKHLGWAIEIVKDPALRKKIEEALR